ncbi:MAG: ribulose-phosphate 3-epimerase [Alphaproteobacteria bacterium]|nr:ribulose-phosphate 3-epimerase [Alphaproteobacteria bacterium]
MALIAPSLLAADFRYLSEQVKLVETAGADWLHFDIMDGHFVPNLSFGADFIRQIRQVSNLFFDVHLMVDDPLKFLPMFADCGADQITVHFEACADLSRVIAYLNERQIKVGISLKPATPAEVLLPYTDKIDNILIMTVEPGFGGQKFMPEILPKIRKTSSFTANKNITLEVDGGINLQTSKQCVECGAGVLVAGSAIFKAKNPAQVVQELKKIGEK